MGCLIVVDYVFVDNDCFYCGVFLVRLSFWWMFVGLIICVFMFFIMLMVFLMSCVLVVRMFFFRNRLFFRLI